MSDLLLFEFKKKLINENLFNKITKTIIKGIKDLKPF